MSAPSPPLPPSTPLTAVRVLQPAGCCLQIGRLLKVHLWRMLQSSRGTSPNVTRGISEATTEGAIQVVRRCNSCVNLVAFILFRASFAIQSNEVGEKVSRHNHPHNHHYSIIIITIFIITFIFIIVITIINITQSPWVVYGSQPLTLIY